MMNILITGASSQLGQQIIAKLVSNQQLRLLDSTMPDIKYENLEFIQGSIVEPNIAHEAVRNIDVLIHTGEPPQSLPQDPLKRKQMLMDLATRGTHLLLRLQLKLESNASSTVVRLKFSATIPTTSTSANFINRCRSRKFIN